MDKYEDPMWIVRRRAILKRDNYKCTVCGSENNLQVHHTYYIRGHELWQYPNDCFLTLCISCHYQYHLEHELIYLDKCPHKPKKKKHKKDKIKNKNMGVIYTYRKIKGIWIKLPPQKPY